MPKDLKWKIVLILLVLVFALIAIYPIQPMLVWSGRVVDVVDARQRVVERINIGDGETHKPFAYYLEKFTLGIFHHKNERYEPVDESKLDEDTLKAVEAARSQADEVIARYAPRGVELEAIARDVELRFAGLTLGLDLAGGAEMRYRIMPQRGEDVQADQMIEIIRKRIDAMGLKEPIITTEGSDKIHIELPGEDDQEIDRIRNIIESTGHLEFRLVSSNEEILQQARHSDVPPEGYTWYEMRTRKRTSEEPQKLLIKDTPELTGEFITSTGIQVDPMTREISVSLDFSAEGRLRFLDVTEANIGERLAIILDDIRDAGGKIVKKGTLYSAPNIKQAIWGSAVISGGFTDDEARDLRTTLEAGSLPASLIREELNTVGPSLGRDSIDAGQRAIIIGFIAVVVFMLLYYRKAGIVANIALLFNLLLVVAALSTYRATLTLPGIAGLILTVGMAVDANVLIFERIREEMEKKGGERLLLAIRDGYSRATVTIVDANLTTLGTALFLYMIGTGPVKGFAATLSLGIIFSMFTAIFVTRVIFEFFVAKGWIHKLGMGKLIGDSAIQFLKAVKYATAVSAVVFAIGLSIFFSVGEDKYDIDFRGGTMMHIVTQTGVSDSDARSLLSPLPDLSVQPVTTNSEMSEFIIKTSARGESTIRGSERITDPETGSVKYAVSVITDRQMDIDEIKERLVDRGHAEPEVDYKSGPEGATFVVTIDAPEARRAESTVSEVFEDLSVKAEAARLLEGKLVEDGFLSAGVSEGIVQMHVDFGRPVAVESVRSKLAEEGYVDPVVSVAGNSEAAEGTVLDIQARAKAEDPDALRSLLRKEFRVPEPFRNVRSVGPHAAKGLRTTAIVAILLSFVFIIGYIWFRFELQYGFAAVVALVHDVGITVGLLTLFGIPFNLTIIGYSLNDTIVVFDRVRENLHLLRRERFENLVNISINQTLSRTLLTSATTLVAVLALLIFGGGVIRHFALTMIIGVLVGTYSSIFIASPLVVALHKRAERNRQTAGAASPAASKS